MAEGLYDTDALFLVLQLTFKFRINYKHKYYYLCYVDRDNWNAPIFIELFNNVILCMYVCMFLFHDYVGVQYPDTWFQHLRQSNNTETPTSTPDEATAETDTLPTQDEQEDEPSLSQTPDEVQAIDLLEMEFEMAKHQLLETFQKK